LAGVGDRKSGTFLARGRAVPYAVRRNPRARRVWIRLGSDGTLVVVFPRWGRLSEAPALLEKHRPWVERALERHAERALRAPLPFGEGPTVRYRGRELPLGVEAGPHRGVRFSRRGFAVTVAPTAGVGESSEVGSRRPGAAPAKTRDEGRETTDSAEGVPRQRRLPFDTPVGPPTSDVRRALEAWYRARAATLLAKRVALFARRLGRRPARLTVRDTRSRWGSCSAKGTLSFTWRLLMAPPAVLDYVVLHELCHLVRPDHSPRFWALVEQHCPEFRTHRAWLRHHAILLTA